MNRSDYHSGERPELLHLIDFPYSRTLEIGCGSGNFSKHLSAATETWGVEPNAQYANLARSHLDTVLTGKYEEVESSIQSNFFDLIICNDVIEHLPDHEAFFRSIYTKMSRGGHLIGSVPNVRYYPHLVALLAKKDWKYEETGILDRTHLRFFTETSLRQCLESHQFIDVETTLVNPIQWRNDSWGWKHRPLLVAMNILTFGSLKDTPFMQIAFRTTR